MADRKTTFEKAQLDIAKEPIFPMSGVVNELPNAKPVQLAGIIAEIEARTDSFTTEEWDMMAQFAAKWTLRQVGKLDPRWARLIDAARVETNCEDWQLVGRWIARVLESGSHLNAPFHPHFEPESRPGVEKACEWPACGAMFKPEFPGQRFHSNECGTKFFNEQRQQVMAEAAEFARKKGEYAKPAVQGIATKA